MREREREQDRGKGESKTEEKEREREQDREDREKEQINFKSGLFVNYTFLCVCWKITGSKIYNQANNMLIHKP